ncbi:MAG: prephenate dehydrogenase [Clostridiales bacterium]|jgi:prephenate dehydrogenase|nr:prephenate dehydrogenase [Clostridiales bacterium]
MENFIAGIVGLGLIGGSLAQGLRAKCGAGKIIGRDTSREAVRAALRDGAIDQAAENIDETFAPCDVIFLCTSVRTIPGLVERLLPVTKQDCVLTDVCSTKLSIMAGIPSEAASRYVGGHPMAGSEKTGYMAARPYLFENAYYILTPTRQTRPESLNKLTRVVSALGAIPMIMPPETHDRAVAAISHAPHIVAAMLVNLVRGSEDSDIMRRLAAGGFKDITRIASSDPAMWNEICVDNRGEILKILSRLKDQLACAEEFLNTGRAEEFFKAAKEYRDSFQTVTQPERIYEIKIDVEDKPGIIAVVATLLCAGGLNIKNIGVANSREYEGGVLRVELDSETSLRTGREILRKYNFQICE